MTSREQALLPWILLISLYKASPNESSLKIAFSKASILARKPGQDHSQKSNVLLWWESPSALQEVSTQEVWVTTVLSLEKKIMHCVPELSHGYPTSSSSYSTQALDFVTQAMLPRSQISKEILTANRIPAPRGRMPLGQNEMRLTLRCCPELTVDTTSPHGIAEHTASAISNLHFQSRTEFWVQFWLRNMIILFHHLKTALKTSRHDSGCWKSHHLGGRDR